MRAKRWIWISGWGLPPEWFREQVTRVLPGDEHVVLFPGRETLAAIDWSEFDCVGGYSLGAFLLLKRAEMVTVPAFLLAPFFAFPAEAGLGGKTRLGQIRYLARWLKNDPCAALADFYGRAELGVEPPTEIPYPIEDLQWGLDQLAHERAPVRLPETWTGLVGDADPLLDAGVLVAREPRLQIVPGAGHHPKALLENRESLSR